MKREFLKGLGLADDLIEQIMAEHGKTMTAAKGDADAQKQQIAARDTEIQGLKEQLAQRDADIKTLQSGAATAEDLKKQLSELQGKYKTDTDALNQRLKDQQTGFERQTATERFFADVKFTSDLAKRAAIAAFGEKGLKLEGGAFVGAKEWLDALKKENPTAFVQEEPAPAAQPKPSFGGSVNGAQSSGQQNANPFNFGFGAVRNVPKQ